MRCVPKISPSKETDLIPESFLKAKTEESPSDQTPHGSQIDHPSSKN